MSFASDDFETEEHIRGFGPEQVWGVGKNPDTWPSIPGVFVVPDGELALGGIVRAGLRVPLTRHEFAIVGEITEFVENVGIIVVGKSEDAEGFVQLSLKSDEIGTGTRVTWGFDLNPLSKKATLAEPLVKRFAKQAIPRFAKQYKRTVIKELNYRRPAA